METAAAESSPTPSTTTNKLKTVFSKTRRGHKDNSSSLSVNDADSTNSGSHGIRASFEATIDKVRTRASGEHDDDGNSSGSGGISKLIPGRIKKKRRKRDAEAEQQDAEELQRGRSIGDRGGGVDPSRGNSAPLTTTVSQDGPDGDDGSSLITYESDTEP